MGQYVILTLCHNYNEYERTGIRNVKILSPAKQIRSKNKEYALFSQIKVLKKFCCKICCFSNLFVLHVVRIIR